MQYIWYIKGRLNKNKEVDFCTNCRKKVIYNVGKKKILKSIEEKKYNFTITIATCSECNKEMDIPGLLDLNAKEVESQYKKLKDLK